MSINGSIVIACIYASAALAFFVMARTARRRYASLWSGAFAIFAFAELSRLALASERWSNPVRFVGAAILIAGTFELIHHRPPSLAVRRRSVAVASAIVIVLVLADFLTVEAGLIAGAVAVACVFQLNAVIATKRRSLATTLLGIASMTACLSVILIANSAIDSVVDLFATAFLTIALLLASFEDEHRRATAAASNAEALAYHDVLTGMPNRSLFFDRLVLALSQAARYGHRSAVVFFDIDHFKEINDSLGHAAGDEVLREVAGRIRDTLRSGDTVARFGGDEFTVLLPRIDRVDEAEAVAQKIVDVIALPMRLSSRKVSITTSVGVSIFPDDATQAEALVRNADTAMYRAKEDGRNAWRLYASASDLGNVARLELESALQTAIERNELRLEYQPVIDLKMHSVVSVEAFLRWHHPTLGVLPPSRFLPIAELTGSSLAIGRWALGEALRDLKRFRETGAHEVTVTMNLTEAQFRSPTFVRDVREQIASAGADPRDLELELAEPLLMRDPERSIETMNAIARTGVHLAIDNFGTGYSSLTYLRRLPISTLKLDRTFLGDLDSTHGSLAAAVINLARSLGMRVIAESIESEDEIAFLRVNFCNLVQGHYFSVPLSADGMVAFLARKKNPLPEMTAVSSQAKAGVRRALVVDDDAVIRRMVQRVLERGGFEVETVKDGFDAIERLRESDFSVMMLDIMMPGLDGYGVIDYLKKNRPDKLPSVVVMTAISPVALERVSKEPVGRIIPKPFDVDQLLAAANECSWLTQQAS